MSRAIPSSLLSALIGDSIQPYFAVELMFDTRTTTDINGDTIDIGPLRMWTGLGDKTINVQGSNQVFTGTGSLLTIGDLEEVGDLASKSVELTLSGIPTSIVSLALQEPYQRRVMRLYLGEQERPSGWRYTNENHQSRYAGDTFFSYVQSLQDQTLVWGK